MASFTINMQEFCVEAYRCLKDDASNRACHIRYRNGSNNYIDFIMEKESYYFGHWALFDGNMFVATIDEQLLKKWSEDAELEKESKKAVK